MSALCQGTVKFVNLAMSVYAFFTHFKSPKTGLGRMVATQPHVQPRRPEIVEMKAETETLTAIPRLTPTTKNKVVNDGVKIPQI